MARKYFVLARRDYYPALAEFSPWGVEFGAYDRGDVQDEFDNLVEQGVPRARMKVVMVNSDTQAAIDAAIVKLNVRK